MTTKRHAQILLNCLRNGQTPKWVLDIGQQDQWRLDFVQDVLQAIANDECGDDGPYCDEIYHSHHRLQWANSSLERASYGGLLSVQSENGIWFRDHRIAYAMQLEMQEVYRSVRSAMEVKQTANQPVLA